MRACAELGFAVDLEAVEARRALLQPILAHGAPLLLSSLALAWVSSRGPRRRTERGKAADTLGWTLGQSALTQPAAVAQAHADTLAGPAPASSARLAL